MRCVTQGQIVAVTRGNDYTNKKGEVKASHNLVLLPEGDLDTCRMLLDDKLSPEIQPGRYKVQFDLVRPVNKPVWYRAVAVEVVK